MTNEWSIHSKGFGKAPVRLLEDDRLNVYAKILYITISTFANKDGKCYPSERAILERCGLGRSTFYKYKNELIKYGYMTSYQPKKKGEQFQSCQYTLLGYSEIEPFENTDKDIKKEDEEVQKNESTAYCGAIHGQSTEQYTDSPSDNTRSVKHNTDGNSIISSFMKKSPCVAAQYTNNITDHINRPCITDQALQPSVDNIYSEYEVIYDATVKYAKEVKNHELTEQEKIAIKKVIGQTKGKYDPKTYFDFKG